MRVSVWATATPVFGVLDLARSTRFYTYGLGFAFIHGAATPADGMPAFALLRRGAVELLVYEREPADYRTLEGVEQRTTLLYVVVSDVETLSAELRIRRIRVASGDSGGAGRYCDVEDPDGNILRFGAGSHPVLEALSGATRDGGSSEP